MSWIEMNISRLWSPFLPFPINEEIKNLKSTSYMFLIVIACRQDFVDIHNNIYSSESDGFFLVTINSIISNRDLQSNAYNTQSYSRGQLWPPGNPQKWHDLSNNPHHSGSGWPHKPATAMVQWQATVLSIFISRLYHVWHLMSCTYKSVPYNHSSLQSIVIFNT